MLSYYSIFLSIQVTGENIKEISEANKYEWRYICCIITAHNRLVIG